MLCVAALHKALICRQTILSARTRMVTGFDSWDGLHRLRAWECVDISFPELVTRIRRVEPCQHGGERFLYSVALKVVPSFPLLKAAHTPRVTKTSCMDSYRWPCGTLMSLQMALMLLSPSLSWPAATQRSWSVWMLIWPSGKSAQSFIELVSMIGSANMPKFGCSTFQVRGTFRDGALFASM